jgi:hypothetical protein
VRLTSRVVDADGNRHPTSAAGGFRGRGSGVWRGGGKRAKCTR